MCVLAAQTAGRGVMNGFQEVKRQQQQGLKRENKKEHTEDTSGVPQGLQISDQPLPNLLFSAMGPGFDVLTQERLTWRTLSP